MTYPRALVILALLTAIVALAIDGGHDGLIFWLAICLFCV